MTLSWVNTHWFPTLLDFEELATVADLVNLADLIDAAARGGKPNKPVLHSALVLPLVLAPAILQGGNSKDAGHLCFLDLQVIQEITTMVSSQPNGNEEEKAATWHQIIEKFEQTVFSMFDAFKDYLPITHLDVMDSATIHNFQQAAQNAFLTGFTHQLAHFGALATSTSGP